MARKFDHARFAQLLERALETGPIDKPQRLSQKDFATRVGVDPATVYRWSTGKTTPGRKTVASIASLFGWPSALVDELYLRSPVSRAMAAEDLEHWIEVTGLRHDFPLLRRPRWFDEEPWAEADENSEAGPVLATHPREIYELLQVEGVIEFPVGHGVSTAVREAHRVAVGMCLPARTIPVMVSIEDLVDAPYAEMLGASLSLLQEWHPKAGSGSFDESPARVEKLLERANEAATAFLGGITAQHARDVIQQRIRWNVVKALLSRRWERSLLDREPYLRLLGVDAPDPRVDEQSAHAERRSLDEHRALLRQLLPSETAGDWSQLEVLAPDLVRNTPREIFRELNSLRLRLLLLVDLSPTPIGRAYPGPDHGECLTEAYLGTASSMLQALKHFVEPGGAGWVEQAEGSYIDIMIAGPRSPLLEEFSFLVDDRLREAPPLGPEHLYDILRLDAFRSGVNMPANGLDDVVDRRYLLELPAKCGLTTASWFLRQALALAPDRRVRDRGDADTSQRLRSLLELEPEELKRLVRLLELEGFVRSKPGSGMRGS